MPLSREEILKIPVLYLSNYEFEAMDALVAMVSKGTDDDPRLRDVIEQNNLWRVYPVDGGNLYEFLFRKSDHFDPDFFQIEQGAWDHEHCDMCEERIEVGIVLLCPQCRNAHFKQRRPWWKFW